ncbi:MAG: formylglycine-generating enzyme family protein [Limnospira sp.]
MTDTFEFETVRVNAEGEIIGRERESAKCYTEDLGEGVQLELVAIPAGTFLMGSPEDEPDRDEDESPQREVSVSAFLMGKYPVTQAQWRAIVTRVPTIRRELDPDPSSFQFKGDDRPIEAVSWRDAVEFCARLSQYAGETYRLPSEAEWEYACRAGTTTPFHFGETLATELANYNGEYAYDDGPEGEYRQETTPVGYFQIPNAFGLYDMHGNVDEWCADPWHGNYEGAPEDGRVWDEDNNNCYQSYGNEELSDLLADERPRVHRGGSWDNDPWDCRCAYRSSINSDYSNDDLGFRVLRVPPNTR